MAGDGWHNGNHEAFLLSYTPDSVFDPKPIYIPPVIPEPETYMMFLGGLGLIGFLARRRLPIKMPEMVPSRFNVSLLKRFMILTGSFLFFGT